MTFKLYYSGLISLLTLKNSLTFLYPEQSDKISNIVDDLNIDDAILILNDVVKGVDYDNHVYSIYDNIFIKIINILKECDNDIIIIKVENEKDQFSLVETNEIFKLRGAFYEPYFYVKTTKNIYNLTLFQKNTFFSNYKTIDAKSYIRMIKLKQLL